MRKSVFLIPALVVALTSSAFAQDVSKSKDAADTVKITVSGNFEPTWIYRDRVLADFATSTNPADSQSEVFPGKTTGLMLSAELSKNVAVNLQGVLDPDGALGNNSYSLVVRDANMKVREILDPAATFTFGQFQFKHNLRGDRGNPLILDSYDSATLSLSQSADPRSSLDSGYSFGGALGYNRENISVTVAALPKVNQTTDLGRPSDDESIYAISFFLGMDSLGKGSRIGALASSFGASGSDTKVYTLSIGADLVDLAPRLEAFGEVAFQFGDAGAAPSGTATADAGGLAFQFGGRYDFEAEQKPWIEGKVISYSGDDDATDNDNENAIVHSYQTDLAIFQDPWIGRIGARRNYLAFIATAGFKPAPDFDVWFAGGIGKLNEKISVGSPASNEDGLGNEVDVKARWNLNKAAHLDVGLAYAFGSDLMEKLSTDKDDSTWLFTLGGGASF